MNFVAAGSAPTARSAPPRFSAKADILVSVQVLRGFAALAVTIFHLRPYYGINFGIRDALPTSLSVGAVGVHVFFVISGFVIVYSSMKSLNYPNPAAEFFARRCIRVVPMYWGLSLVIMLHTFIVYGAHILSPSVIASSFAFIPFPRPSGAMYPIVVVGWTLNYEMFFYIVYALALLLLRQAAVIGASVFFLAIVIVGVLLGRLPQPFAFWTSAIILEFVVGMLLAVACRDGVTLPGWLSVLLIIIALIGLFLSSHDWGNIPRGAIWGTAAALLVGGAVLGPKLHPRSRLWKPMNLLGDSSYSLYLVHPFAFALPRWCAPQLLQPAERPWTYASIIVVAAIVVAVATHLLIEKPVTLSLNRWWSRRSEASATASIGAASRRPVEIAMSEASGD